MGRDENAEALRAAGLIDDEVERLPDEYYKVMDEMSAEEVEALVSLKQRLADHDIAVQPLTAQYAVEFGPIMGPVF